MLKILHDNAKRKIRKMFNILISFFFDFFLRAVCLYLEIIYISILRRINQFDSFLTLYASSTVLSGLAALSSSRAR